MKHSSTVLMDGRRLPLESLERIAGFKYTGCLVFETLELLRDYDYWRGAENECPESSCVKCRLRSQHQVQWKERLHAGAMEELDLKSSQLTGIGGHSLRRLEAGDFLGEYTGLVKMRVEEPKTHDTYGCSYCAVEGCSVWLSAAKHGSLMRFINHSSSPNCSLMYLEADDGVVHVIVVVMAPQILPGEQLSLDYGVGYWSESSEQPISLSSTSCV